MALELTYVLCGLAMAAFYVPQILACANDRSGLAAYSLSKAVVQLGCRSLMLPFVWVTVDSATMLTIQSIDVALRAVEVACALGSLHRQGIDWRFAMQARASGEVARSTRLTSGITWRMPAGPMNAVWRHGRQRSTPVAAPRQIVLQGRAAAQAPHRGRSEMHPKTSCAAEAARLAAT